MLSSKLGRVSFVFSLHEYSTWPRNNFLHEIFNYTSEKLTNATIAFLYPTPNTTASSKTTQNSKPNRAPTAVACPPPPFKKNTNYQNYVKTYHMIVNKFFKSLEFTYIKFKLKTKTYTHSPIYAVDTFRYKLCEWESCKKYYGPLKWTHTKT